MQMIWQPNCIYIKFSANCIIHQRKSMHWLYDWDRFWFIVFSYHISEMFWFCCYNFTRPTGIAESVAEEKVGWPKCNSCSLVSISALCQTPGSSHVRWRDSGILQTVYLPVICKNKRAKKLQHHMFVHVLSNRIFMRKHFKWTVQCKELLRTTALSWSTLFFSSPWLPRTG